MTKLYLSVDLEKDPWTNLIPIEETSTLLDLLKETGQQITFFVSGELFEEAPELVARVAEAGHEIGLHSFHHQVIKNTAFLRQELTLSQKFISLYRPKGFRAPGIYLPEGSLNIIKEFSFEYDSSTFFPNTVQSGLTELPVSSWKLLPTNPRLSTPRGPLESLINFELPYGSGLITTIAPAIQRFFINRSKLPSIIFIHPWQLHSHGLNSNWKLIPYALPALSAITHLCKHYKLAKMEELLNENQFESI